MRLSFVIPWFSRHPGGGAETLFAAFAARLAAAGHDVEILSTTSRDHDGDWYRDHHPAGRVTIDGDGPSRFAVERFPACPGDAALFQTLNRRILGGDVLSPDDENRFYANSIRSPALLAATTARLDHRLVIAGPYLFGLIHDLIVANPGRVVTWPCVHDEPYARLRLSAVAWHATRAVVFNSAPERDLARALYADTRPSAVVGPGIDTHAPPVTPPSAAAAPAPYLIYLGRKSPEKGVDHLVALFSAWRRRRGGGVELHLAGKGDCHAGPGIVDHGFVSELEKVRLLAGSVAVAVPSRRESFSLAMLEGLAAGVPALVDAGSGVPLHHARTGCCGLFYSDAAEFAECAEVLLTDRSARDRLAAAGRAYAATFSWPGRIKALEQFLAPIHPATAGAEAGGTAP